MSKSSKKRVVTTVKTSESKLKPTSSKGSGKSSKAPRGEGHEMVYKKINFMYMFAGLGLILIGYILMAGGEMPDPNVWDDNIIYSFRRITLAPILILAGFVLQIFAIFK